MSKLLQRKIKRDDIIIINEDLLPKKVIRKHLSGQGFTHGKTYDVIGMTWEVYPDRTRTLVYVLIDDENRVRLASTIHFQITVKKN